MKKIICVLMVLLFVCSCSCGSSEDRLSSAPVKKESVMRYTVTYQDLKGTEHTIDVYDYYNREGLLVLTFEDGRSEDNRLYILSGPVRIKKK